MKFAVAFQRCWQLRIFLSFIKTNCSTWAWTGFSHSLWMTEPVSYCICCSVSGKKKKCGVQKYSWLSHEKSSFWSFSESGGRICTYLYRCICIGYFYLSGWHLGSPCCEMELHTGDTLILKMLKFAKLSYRE